MNRGSPAAIGREGKEKEEEEKQEKEGGEGDSHEIKQPHTQGGEKLIIRHFYTKHTKPTTSAGSSDKSQTLCHPLKPQKFPGGHFEYRMSENGSIFVFF